MKSFIFSWVLASLIILIKDAYYESIRRARTGDSCGGDHVMAAKSCDDLIKADVFENTVKNFAGHIYFEHQPFVV